MFHHKRKEVLEWEGVEVESMLIAEYDYDTDVAVQREESFEEGELKGIDNLANAIKALKSGTSKEDLLLQYSSRVADIAIQLI